MMRDLLAPLRGVLIFALCGILTSSLYAQTEPLKLSLHDCIRYHQESPAPSAQLEAQRQAAHATRLKAQSNFFPQVSLSGGWLYTPAKIKPFSIDLPSWLPPMPLPNIPGIPNLGSAQSWLDDKMSLELGHIFYGSLSLRQPIFAGGRIYNGVRLAKIGEQVAEYQWTIQQRGEEEQIAKTYWQAVQLQEQLKAIGQFNAMLDKTLADVSAMKDQGVVADREVVSVRINRNNAKLQEGKLREGLQALLILLKHQCRIPAEQAIELTPDFTLASQQPIDPCQPKLYSTVNPMERVELKAANLAVEAEKRRAQMALGEMLPEVGFTAQLLAMSPNPMDGFKKQFGSTWMVGVAVQIPITGIYQGVQSRTAALANQQVRQLELQDAERAIQMQNEQASRQLTEALARYAETEQIRTDAKLNLDLSTEGHKEGVVTLETLSLAQRNWLESEMQYIETFVAVRLAQLAVNVATGQPLDL